MVTFLNRLPGRRRQCPVKGLDAACPGAPDELTDGRSVVRLAPGHVYFEIA